MGHCIPGTPKLYPSCEIDGYQRARERCRRRIRLRKKYRRLQEVTTAEHLSKVALNEYLELTPDHMLSMQILNEVGSGQIYVIQYASVTYYVIRGEYVGMTSTGVSKVSVDSIRGVNETFYIRKSGRFMSLDSIDFLNSRKASQES